MNEPAQAAMTPEQQEAKRAYGRECQRKYRAANPERAREITRVASRKYRATHSERVRERRHKRRAANPNKGRERARKWAAANPGKARAKVARRHAAKLKRTPAWADLKAITDFFESTPPGYHVDHYFPLQGRTVSGLHVLENLRYLPASENSRKRNAMPRVQIFCLPNAEEIRRHERQ